MGACDNMSEGKSAKEISKWSMVIAAIWIGFLCVIKGFSMIIFQAEFGLTVKEIIFSGVALAAVFSPVYFSIILDKIKDIKIGQ
jgi:hypothetical protein